MRDFGNLIVSVASPSSFFHLFTYSRAQLGEFYLGVFLSIPKQMYIILAWVLVIFAFFQLEHNALPLCFVYL